MASTSTNLGLNLPDGTDVFDNDLYLKGNFQKLDTTVLPKTKSIVADGQNIEVVTVSINSGGATNNITGTGTFTKTYNNVPVVIPGDVSQTVAYADAMTHPLIFNKSKTGFSVKLLTAVQSNNFGAGTLIMNFLVIGS